MQGFGELKQNSSYPGFFTSDLSLPKSITFPGGTDGRESACNARDRCSIPGSGRSPGEGNGNPPPCSCLGNPMDRVAWQTTVCGVRQSQT